MLYYNKLEIEKYYKENKIITILEISDKGFYYRDTIIPFSETIVFLKNNKYIIVPRYPYIGEILGELDI